MRPRVVTPDLSRIPTATPGRLAIAARPRGGDWLADEMAGWQRAGIDVVVSMLTTEEEAELGLTGEGYSCETAGIEFVALSVPDREVPSADDGFAEVVADATQAIRGGATVAVHCRQGIGRSAVFAVAALKTLGLTTDDAVRAVSAARGRPVPETPAQTEWLQRFNPTQPAATGVP